jgi:hypothetical protein
MSMERRLAKLLKVALRIHGFRVLQIQPGDVAGTVRLVLKDQEPQERSETAVEAKYVTGD